MKTKWFKTFATFVALMFCMSAFYIPAYATEITEDMETPGFTGGMEPADLESGLFGLEEPLVGDDEPDADGEAVEETAEPEPESFIPVGSGFRPFAPPGTGTVVDNAIDGDGKEFYTISTDEGDIFYLIIDRQRNTHNVYFLNAVTELDLLALAAKNKRELPAGVTVTPPQGQTAEEGQNPPDLPKPDEPHKKSGNNTMFIILGIAFAGACGAAYYFKIVKGKKSMVDDDDYDDPGEDEYGYEDEPDDNNGNDDEEGGDRE